MTRTADKHGLTGFFDRIVEAPKSKRLFQRVQKLGRVRVPAFMIGDQLTRDIEPAKAAGLVTIYVPSRFRPGGSGRKPRSAPTTESSSSTKQLRSF